MREWTETQGSPPSCTRLERYTTRNCRYSLMMIRTKLSKSHRVPQRLLSVSSIEDSELGGCREFWGFRKLILHRTGTWSSGAVFPFLSRRDLRASSSLYRLHPFYQFFLQFATFEQSGLEGKDVHDSAGWGTFFSIGSVRRLECIELTWFSRYASGCDMS